MDANSIKTRSIHKVNGNGFSFVLGVSCTISLIPAVALANMPVPVQTPHFASGAWQNHAASAFHQASSVKPAVSAVLGPHVPVNQTN
jgi:hypothetical protein